MKDEASATKPEFLLAHREFVRALAGALIADPASADDVAQQVWLTTLEHPPRTATNLRGWLGSIVRNFVRMTARREHRRSLREHGAARPDWTASTAEIVEREAARRRVVEAVFGLEEPYRSTVLLRFYEGLTPEQIAH